MTKKNLWFKKSLMLMLALAILLAPATAFAASKVKIGNIQYYERKIDTNLDSLSRQQPKVEKVNIGMTKVYTTNAKQLAKLKLLQTKMNNYITAAETGLDEANVLLNDMNVGDPKSEIKALKKKVKAIQKNIRKADRTRRDLKHRLENLRIVI